MRLRKTAWRLIVLSAVAMVWTACGSSGWDLTCSGPDDCLESELCHPDDKVCVQMCTSRADCPLKAESCEALSDSIPQKICKCPTKECVGDSDP